MDGEEDDLLAEQLANPPQALEAENNENDEQVVNELVNDWFRQEEGWQKRELLRATMQRAPGAVRRGFDGPLLSGTSH